MENEKDLSDKAKLTQTVENKRMPIDKGSESSFVSD